MWESGEQNEQHLPLCFHISFPINLGAFDGESGLWSFGRAPDCLQRSQSMVCTPRPDSDG